MSENLRGDFLDSHCILSKHSHKMAKTRAEYRYTGTLEDFYRCYCKWTLPVG